MKREKVHKCLSLIFKALEQCKKSASRKKFLSEIIEKLDYQTNKNK